MDFFAKNIFFNIKKKYLNSLINYHIVVVEYLDRRINELHPTNSPYYENI